MGQHGEAGEVLIQQADQAMYLAKSKGKNQFVFHTSVDESMS